jgi:RNA polymerase sigma-70 factor, ECF subfamily
MSPDPTTAAVLDLDAHEWPRSLRTPGPAGDEARACLRAHLLRAARFEVARRSRSLPDLRRDELAAIALETADCAYARVLECLDDFDAGDDRRFGTWAAKFALHEATARLQTRAWLGRELPAEPVLPAAIADALTAHQRRVLGALAVNGVPIDVLAERLETSRGAVYETLRQARQTLREHLGPQGLTVV